MDQPRIPPNSNCWGVPSPEVGNRQCPGRDWRSQCQVSGSNCLDLAWAQHRRQWERTRNTKLLKMPLCKFAKISLSIAFARKGSLMTKALFYPDVTGLWAHSDNTTQGRVSSESRLYSVGTGWIAVTALVCSYHVMLPPSPPLTIVTLDIRQHTSWWRRPLLTTGHWMLWLYAIVMTEMRRDLLLSNHFSGEL